MMNSSQILVSCMIVLIMLSCSGCVGGGSSAQQFDTNWGKVQIEIPQKADLTSIDNAGNSITLMKGTTPVIIMMLSESSQSSDLSSIATLNGLDLSSMVAPVGAKDNTAVSEDNHKISWYLNPMSPSKQYMGSIDYKEDKNLIVNFIVTPLYYDTTSNKIVTILEENDVLNILKSFKFVGSNTNSKKSQSISTNQASIPSTVPDNTKPENIVLGPYTVSFDLGNVGAYSINVEQPEEKEEGTIYGAIIESSAPSWFTIHMGIKVGHANKPVSDFEEIRELLASDPDCDEPTFDARTIDGKPGTIVSITCSEWLADAFLYPVDYIPEDKTTTSEFIILSAFPRDEGTSREEVISSLLKTIHVEKRGSSNAPSEINPASPSNGQEPGAFHMAVIGDSIAWGNGLNKEDKYPYLVADWLEEKLDRPVEVTVYAHSGATISGESGEAIDQNLNSGSPTLMDQAKNIKDKDDVDLILVSGGINDVGIMNILNVYIPSDEIDQSAQSIREPMKDLLLSLLNECKNAKIIVTNYYPVVSEDSEIKTIQALYGLGVFSINEATDKNVLDAFTVKEKLIENSYMFNGGSLTALTQAVNDANNGEKRITLAMVNFQPENCYAASQTWLWKLEGLKTNDDQFDYRSSLTSDPINKINAIGHPNRDGAIEYARAIKSAIESKGLNWLPNGALADSEASVSQGVSDSDIASVTEPTSDTSPLPENNDANTKTAYTKDGINFISEERLEQNVRNGLANLGEYEKVKVSLDAVVIEASPE